MKNSSPTHLQTLQRVLARSPVFEDLTSTTLATVVSLLTDRKLEADEYLFQAGEEGDSLAILLLGQLEVELKSRKVSVLPYEVIGEMACLDPCLRSASVKAIEPTRTSILSRKSLLAVRESSPRVYAQIHNAICRRIAERLRDSVASAESDAPTTSFERDLTPAIRVQRRSIPLADIQLEHLSALDELSAEQIQNLKLIGQAFEYEPGSVLCLEGAASQNCFIIVEGTVQASRMNHTQGEVRVLGRAGQGALVGHMALMDQGPRLATLAAESRCVTLEINAPIFKMLIEAGTPLAIRMQEKVAIASIRHLRRTNQNSAFDQEMTTAETTAVQRRDWVVESLDEDTIVDR